MVVLPQVTAAAREALDEYWVRGDQPNSAGMTIDAVADAALQLYFSNFEQRWSGVLTDMRVRSSQTLSDATETVRILASDPSPVETLARAIVAATDLRPQGGDEIVTVGKIRKRRSHPPLRVLQTLQTCSVNCAEPSKRQSKWVRILGQARSLAHSWRRCSPF